MRNFPCQPANSYLFSDSDSSNYPEVLNDFIIKFGRLSDPRSQFILEEPADWKIEHMASSPLSMAFLAFMVRVIKAKRVLEIGTFVGLGSMLLAKAMPADGVVVTIEKFSVFADMARRNIQLNNFERRIRVLTGEMSELVEAGQLSPKFDFILLDGGKEHYEEYL